MKENKNNPLIQPFLSGSMLKLLAMTLMLLDHTALFLLSEYPAYTEPFISLLGKGISICYGMRLVGRMAFPIFVFLLVEGFVHTKNRRKYGTRLLIFALLSELPWNYLHSGGLFYASQSVMFTLFLGYLGLCALVYLEEDKPKQVFCLIVLFVICTFGRMDYGARGFGLVLMMYLLRKKTIAEGILTGCILNTGWAAALAFVPIGLYNRQRGFMKGKIGKYAGYLFYPLHMLLLGLLKYYVLKI